MQTAVPRQSRPRLQPAAYLLTAALAAALLLPALRLRDQGWLAAGLAQLARQCPAVGQFGWIVSEPGLAAQRLVTVIGRHEGGVATSGIVVAILAGAVVLAATALKRDAAGRRQPALPLLAAGLAASPLFLEPVLEAEPWFWGACVWYGCVRALCRVEAAASLQMEMALGVGLAGLVLVEPAAAAVVLVTTPLLPLALRRRPERSSVSALILILAPPVLVLLAQFAAQVVHGDSVWLASRQWTAGRAWLPAAVLGGAPPAPADRVVGFLPWMLSPAVLLTPLLPWLATLVTDLRPTNRAISLTVALIVPLVVGSLLSWRLGTPVYRPWLLYLLMGQAAWLVETYGPDLRHRLLLACFWLWTLVSLSVGLFLR